MSVRTVDTIERHKPTSVEIPDPLPPGPDPLPDPDPAPLPDPAPAPLPDPARGPRERNPPQAQAGSRSSSDEAEP
jgi:hypothetical protein